MSYEAPRTTVGFERVYNMAGFPSNPVPYELKGNTAFKKGALVVIDDGLLDVADNNTTSKVVGVMAEEVKQADNPSDEVTYGMVYDNPLDVFRVSVADHLDVTATGGSATRFEATGEFNDDMEGSVIYVYEGPSKGAVRTISNSADNFVDVYEPFPEDITTDSKAVVLGEDGASGAIYIGKDGVFADSDGLKLNCDKAPDDGPLTVVGIDAPNLMMDVVLDNVKG